MWRESGSYYGFGADTHWNKFGKSYWFSTNEWSGVRAELLDVQTEHLQDVYLDYLRGRPAVDAFKNRYEAIERLEPSYME